MKNSLEKYVHIRSRTATNQDNDNTGNYVMQDILGGLACRKK